jgi:hypothetical protein
MENIIIGIITGTTLSILTILMLKASKKIENYREDKYFSELIKNRY